MYIGAPGFGSFPGPPAIAPWLASGVNGEVTVRHEILCPSIAPLCASTVALRQLSNEARTTRPPQRPNRGTAYPSTRMTGPWSMSTADRYFDLSQLGHPRPLWILRWSNYARQGSMSAMSAATSAKAALLHLGLRGAHASLRRSVPPAFPTRPLRRPGWPS
jgi:hypothetical protein